MTRAARAEVSIVIPTRDREEWLPRTLLSAFNQREVRSEVIVVDDGSRTPVANHLTESALSRVRVVRHVTPRGVAAARNAGINAARGRWVAFLDDDDIWAPHKLVRQIGALHDVDAKLAYCGGVILDEAGRVLQQAEPPASTTLHHELLSSMVIPFPSSNLLADTELVRSLGGFDESFSHLADWDLLLRLSVEANGAPIREPLVGYTVHATNMQQNETGVDEEMKNLERKYRSERVEHDVVVDRVPWLRWRIGAHRLAGDRRGSAKAYLELGKLTRNPFHALRGVALWAGGERAMAIARAGRRRRLNPVAPEWLGAAANPPDAALRAVWR